MSVFQKSTCKRWQNCLRIWNQSRACNWFWCLSTRSASKWGQEAHVNTDNATKIFSAQVLPATHTAFIRCYTTRLHIMATRLCQCTCMCGYYNANERFGSKDMISGVHYRCFCQPRSVPLSLLAGSAQPIAGLCHLHAGHSENTNSPYMPSKMKNSSLISATHNKKTSRNPENRRRMNKPLPTESFCLHSHPAHGGSEDVTWRLTSLSKLSLSSK